MVMLMIRYLQHSMAAVVTDINAEFDSGYACRVNALSGFDDNDGRPYGGCAILWRANINMHSVMVNTHSTVYVLHVLSLLCGSC